MAQLGSSSLDIQEDLVAFFELCNFRPLILTPRPKYVTRNLRVTIFGDFDEAEYYLESRKRYHHKGKVIAARRDTSISRMLSDLLKGMVENDARYEAAKRSALQLLKKGIHLGGRVAWKREDLYER